MEKGAFLGFVLGFLIAWWRGVLKPHGGEEKEAWLNSTSEYYWRV